MRTKKIKAFSVDEKTYDELITKFKESGAEVSLSYYVDKCLKDLHMYLVAMEKGKKKSRQYNVPMSFIIEEVVKMPIISLEYELPVPGMRMDTFNEIDEWNAEYEARKMKIPRPFYRLIKSGKFELSADRKYITNIKTKIKYTIDQFGEIVSVPDDKTFSPISAEGV